MVTQLNYRPKFTQLSVDFDNDIKNFRTIIRRHGCEYLAYYIMLQNAMASHSDEDFTLSFDDIVDALVEKLYLYQNQDKPEEFVAGIVDVFLDNGVLEICDYCENGVEEQRYYISTVQDTLKDCRDEWLSKVINPSKLPPDVKTRIRDLQQEINKLDAEIKSIGQKRSSLQKKMCNEDDPEVRHAIDADMDELKGKNAEAYRKKATLKKSIDDLRFGSNKN